MKMKQILLGVLQRCGGAQISHMDISGVFLEF